MPSISKVLPRDTYKFWRLRTNQALENINALGTAAFVNIDDMTWNTFVISTTDSYTIRDVDKGKLVHYKGSSSVNIYMPSAISDIRPGWGILIFNDSSSDITVDGNGSYIGDSGSFTLPSGESSHVFFDEDASPIAWAYFTTSGDGGGTSTTYENTTREATDDGTDDYVVSSSFSPSDGNIYWIDFQSTNTTDSPTLDADGTAYDIVKEDGSAESGMIGQRPHGMYFDGTNNNWIIMDPLVEGSGDSVTYTNSTIDTTQVEEDVYETDTDFSPTSGNVYKINFESASSTTEPTLATSGSSPAYDIFPQNEYDRYVGMIGERTHSLYFNGDDFELLDPVEPAYTIFAYDAQDTSGSGSSEDVFYIDKYIVPIDNHVYPIHMLESNTTDSPTMDFDDTNRDIVKVDGTAESGMLENGRVHFLMYDESNGRFVLQNPATDGSDEEIISYNIDPIVVEDTGTDSYNVENGESYNLTDQEIYFVHFDSTNTTDSPTVDLNGSDLRVYTTETSSITQMISPGVHKLKYDYNDGSDRFIIQDPANGIVDKSSNTESICFRYDDGQQYCWGTKTVQDMSSGDAVNDGFSWAFSFNDDPRISVGCEGPYDSSNDVTVHLDSDSTSSNYVYTSFIAHSVSSGSYWDIYVFAQGWWK